MIGKPPLTVNEPMARLYIGTYTRTTASEGIYTCQWDAGSGRFSALAVAARADNPSFVITHQDSLLAVNECGDYQGRDHGAVSSFRMAGDSLTLTAMLPSHGADPCHIAVRGSEAVVANYSGGTVSTFGLQDGVLTGTRRVIRFAAHGEHPRQSSSHPHGVYYRDNELLVPDLGADCIHRVRSSTGHILVPVRVPKRSGPRHLAVAAQGRFYVVNELSNTVNVIEHGRVVQTVPTLPSGAAAASSAAEIVLDPTGQRLFVSNRGHDSVTGWRIEPETGLLGDPAFCAAGGRHPRHFVVDPSGRSLLVANRDSNNVVAIHLTLDGFGGIADSLDCPAPACIALSGN